MTVANFDPCVKLLLVHEGGSFGTGDDDPHDPGGRTSRGITAGDWAEWRKSHPGFPADVWQAPDEQVRLIYKTRYWDAMGADALPKGIDYATFDIAVLQGLGKARPYLAQVQGLEARAAVNKLCDLRLAHMKSLANWARYGRGWGTRVADVRRDALAMVGDTVVPVVGPAAPAEGLLIRVIAGMTLKGYAIDRGIGQINIAYAEGHNRDGSRNFDESGYWNDVRLVWTYGVDGKPVQRGAWTATTRPGPYFTQNRLNPKGAANIVPGQFTAWRVGLHRGSYEALVQRGMLRVARDDNEDYLREGDFIETGDFEGINQHHGANALTVGAHSAGCLVAKMIDGHQDFMSIVKSDPRYAANHSFMFTTAILAQSEIPS